MIAIVIGLTVGGALGWYLLPRLSRPMAIGWCLFAAFATWSIAHTLLVSDPPAAVQAVQVPVAADFAVPADVHGLQGASNLDVIGHRPDGSLDLAGWIFDERTHRAVDAVYVDIDGTSRIEGTYGVARPDVAKAFHSADLTKVGFDVLIKPGTLTAGQHSLRLGMRVGTTRYESVHRFPLTI